MKNLKVYPNPVSETLNIEIQSFNDLRFHLFDIYGRQVEVSPNINSSRTTIDMSQLASGVYFLSIEKEGEMVTRKIIVQ